MKSIDNYISLLVPETDLLEQKFVLLSGRLSANTNFIKKKLNEYSNISIEHYFLLDNIDGTISNLDPESVSRQFEVNAFSPLCFTHAFLESMRAGSKVALITSRMGSIDDNTSGGSYGYRMSKVALCMAGKSLAFDLKHLILILHPRYELGLPLDYHLGLLFRVCTMEHHQIN